MIIFDIFINIIEAYIFPIFLSRYFSLEERKKFILCSGTIQFIILNIYSYYNTGNYDLTLLIILFNILSLIIYFKKIIFEYVFVVLLYNFLILLTSYIGIYIIYFFVSAQILISDYNIQKIFICLIAKCLLIFLTVVILKNKNKYLYYMDISEWRPVLYMQLLLMLSIVVVGYLFLSGHMENGNLLFVAIMLILSNVVYIYILSRIIKLNNDKLAYERQIQQEQANNEKLMIVKNIKNEVDAIDHRLFYVILQMEHLIEENDLDKMTKLVDTYKSIVLKHKMIIDTHNPIFDCLLSLKLNDMIMKDIDIKTSIFISQNAYYDNIAFIDFLTHLFDHLDRSSFIDIDIKEVFSFMKIRIIFEGENIARSALIEYLGSGSFLKDDPYHLEQIDEHKWELDISLKIEG